MEADWEVEIGGGAPAIEAHWPGFVDLRAHPVRIAEIAEAAGFPPLASLLGALNGAGSPLWTSKCDLWEPEAEELARALDGELDEPPSFEAASVLACYIDLLPVEGQVFARWEQAESFCRAWVARLAVFNLTDARLELVVRLALAGQAQGFGVTAYLSGAGGDRCAAGEVLAAAMAAFAEAIPDFPPAATAASKLQ
jgi:hypothetical protein